jgi:hypothetical protein
MNGVVEKRVELAGVLCGLAPPIILTILWIYGVPLIKLITALVIVCIFVCSISCIMISRYNKKIFLELDMGARL